MSNQSHLKFDALTTTGIEILEKLQTSLQSELAALSERNLDLIKQFAVEKSQILVDFSNNTQQRSQLLESLKFSSNEKDIQLFFSSCADPSTKKTCIDNWHTLAQNLKVVIDSNNVNEQVLKRNQYNIDTILSILQGKQANNVLYDAKGDKGDYSGQSRIGKA
ncbi:MAG: hypothetical protein OFPI_21310 [Osedax symbiont Rs2]|nr:MAG: hypothetical protein OFPI_21310 [Osedax symbiont Rs2]